MPSRADCNGSASRRHGGAAGEQLGIGLSGGLGDGGALAASDFDRLLQGDVACQMLESQEGGAPATGWLECLDGLAAARVVGKLG